MANAGMVTIIILPADSITLNRSASTDPDGKTTSYIWVAISGPSSPVIKTPYQPISIVNSLVQGQNQFKLTVSDDRGLSSGDTVSIKVNDAIITNQPPKASAGGDQTITLAVNSLLLDGTASSDPDNNIVSYARTKIEGHASFSFANSSAVRTEAILLLAGTYLFELKVTDADELFSKDTMQVTLNHEPIIHSWIYICGRG